MFLVYGGVGMAAQSSWVLILTLPLAIVIRYGVVRREEMYLERRFGGAYRDYKARVRRWLQTPAGAPMPLDSGRRADASRLRQARRCL